jgi:hypothetical protein
MLVEFELHSNSDCTAFIGLEPQIVEMQTRLRASAGVSFVTSGKCGSQA